ncbi:MAG: hypothetical protein WCG47_22780 [Dermatophilaceae bacterium]
MNHELLPFALGAAISPVPILAVIMTVLAHRARASRGFMLGRGARASR